MAEQPQHRPLIQSEFLFLIHPTTARDYRLIVGSSPIDAGDNSPPGGVGNYDVGGDPRVAGGTVDQGAYEWQGIFGDGFESGNVEAWSDSVN